MEMLNPDAINGLVKLPLETAQVEALAMIGQKNFKVKAAKKNRLIRDISVARSANEVCRIMYFTYLAGEGLSVTGSTWQSHFKEV